MRKHQERLAAECEKQMLHEFESLRVAQLCLGHVMATELDRTRRKQARREKLLEDHLQAIQAGAQGALNALSRGA